MNALAPQAVLAHVRNLPALPQAALELVHCLDDVRFSSQRVGEIIAHDPALAARTLRLANSPFYGLGREVTSLSDASQIVGLRVLHAMAATSIFMGGLTVRPGLHASFHHFWRHALAAGLCAKAIDDALGGTERSAFVAGLLHDIGRLALLDGFEQHCLVAMGYQREHDIPAFEAEQAVLGFDHAYVGGLLAEHWRFSPAMTEAIALHHTPEMRGNRLCDIVHVAENMAHALDLSGDPDDLVPPMRVESWLRLALGHAQCEGIFRLVEAEHQLLCDALLPSEGDDR